MEFIEIQRRLVRAILRIPVAATFDGRSSLLQGLPNVALQRSQGIAQLDLNTIVSELDRLGRLTKNGGMRPVVVVLENALEYVPEGSEIAEELQEVRSLLAGHYGGDVQPEPAAANFEALIFGATRDARVDFAFVERAHGVARSIARLTVPRLFGGAPDGQVVYGTGWIIAPGVLMTNHHVIDARDRRPKPAGLGEQHAAESDFRAQAERATADFDYYREADGAPIECRCARLLASSRELDYAVVELEQPAKVDDRHPFRMVPARPSLKRGARLNIVQHPKGGPLRFAIRNNFFVRTDERPAMMLYQTDTEPGASGSPVCNDDWQVVALHHASVRVPPELVPQEAIDGDLQTVTLLNEAIPIHEILDDLPPELRQRIRENAGA